MTGAPKTPDVGFVACIEDGVLEGQALLLFESIRRYAGRLSGSTLYALSPRAGRSVGAETRRKLAELDVHYIDETLNTECTYYGSANRVAAAAYVERESRHEILVILDSDTLFLREPADLMLDPDVDVGVRPVDLQGICVTGTDDKFEPYWRKLCDCCAVDYEAIPWSTTSVDRRRIKASYNGGLVVARRSCGMLERWNDYFVRSVREQLRPYADPWRLRTGTGWVDGDISRMWGSNQAALSLAMWDTTRRVRELSPTYNYPLHLHELAGPEVLESVFPNLVHVHYHWLLGEDRSANPLFDSGGPLSAEQVDWLGSHPMR